LLVKELRLDYFYLFRPYI